MAVPVCLSLGIFVILIRKLQLHKPQMKSNPVVKISFSGLRGVLLLAKCNVLKLGTVPMHSHLLSPLSINPPELRYTITIPPLPVPPDIPPTAKQLGRAGDPRGVPPLSGLIRAISQRHYLVRKVSRVVASSIRSTYVRQPVLTHPPTPGTRVDAQRGNALPCPALRLINI